MHFARAQRYGEQGFEYMEAHDAYRCPQGEYFSNCTACNDDKPVRRVPGPASQLQRMPIEGAMRSVQPEGRLVFRSLAAWAETNVGVFHRCVSVMMFAAAVGMCMVALWRWGGEAGSAWLAGGLLVGVVLIVQRVQMILRVVRSN